MLKLYPRGYVGPILNNTGDTEVAPASVTNEITIVQNTYKLDTKIKQVDIVPDKDIEKLFAIFRKDTDVIFDFNFRESILRKAKELFSFDGKSNSFKTFINVQLSTGRVTYNHIEVLKEVLDFIYHGKIGFKIVTWERILSYSDNVVYLTDKNKKDLVSEFDNYPKEINSLSKTLQMWVSNPDGYTHLLRVLWLLFGDHTPDFEE